MNQENQKASPAPHTNSVKNIVLLCFLVLLSGFMGWEFSGAVRGPGLRPPADAYKNTSNYPTAQLVQTLIGNKTVSSWAISLTGQVKSVTGMTLTVTQNGNDATVTANNQTGFYNMTPVTPRPGMPPLPPRVSVFTPESVQVGDTVRISIDILPNIAPRITLITLIPKTSYQFYHQTSVPAIPATRPNTIAPTKVK